MACAFHTWVINLNGKKLVCHLQYGPQTQLVRELYLFSLVRTPNSLVFQVHPYPDGKARPTKEIEEFAPKEVFAPYLTFK